MDGLRLTIPGIDADELRLMSLQGNETISQPFQFQLGVLVENNASIEFDKILGQKCSVEIPLPDEKIRHFHGICNRVTQERRGDQFGSYTIEVVPQLWMLTKSAGSRIFQNKSIPDILAEVLASVGIDFESAGLKSDYRPRSYCVQYRETDFNFVSRLMEEEGIHYFFKHDENNHKMILIDESRSPMIVAPIEVLNDGDQRASGEVNRISQWRKTQELRPGKYTLRDFSFQRPTNDLQGMEPTLNALSAGGEEHKLNIGGNEQLEIYDFASEFAHRFDENPDDVLDDIRRTARIRMDEELAASLVIHGVGTCGRFTCGHVFKRKVKINRTDTKMDGEYLLTSVQHMAQSDGFENGKTIGVRYQNSFSCVPNSPLLPFRSPRITAKPFVQGTQTAVVVGPEGEEIHTDKYGRVKVKFHWDRTGEANTGETSCWIRVGTPWAGHHWGMVHIPRVGQEVIVAFQEGDPDQPLIIGSVYNATHEPPYSLPDNKTQSGVKSLSSKEGDANSNFNEIRFEDKKGEEEIYLHAEKNFTKVIKGGESVTVGGGDNGPTDQTIDISGNRKTTIQTGDEAIAIQNGKREVVLDLGDDLLTVKKGNQITKLDLGKIETEAMQSIELKVGDSSIKLDPMGVTIKGLQVKIEGELQTEVKGLMTIMKGSAMTKIDGGAVMLS